jgi:hypothetical protein
VALQPVIYRPITAIKPVARKLTEEPASKPAAERKPGRRRGHALEPGTGENVDTWV